MTISSSLNFGRPVAQGRGSVAGQRFLPQPYYSQCALFASPPSAFHRHMLSNGDAIAVLHDGMVGHHPINKHCVCYIGNISLTK